jgi:dimethylaniline monooxygenase (N-oxide forming)
MPSVAIIGAGPAGLATGRWLKREGFEPVLYEQGDTLGGQWSADPRYSGIWPSMHTNTCREMTQFSDLRHQPGTPLYPGHRTILSYLTRYAERFDLPSRIRLRTRVTRLARHSSGGWTLRSVDHAGVKLEETYPYVVVASGRFNKPKVPDIPGLCAFSGPCGVAHTFNYKDPERYRGRRLLIAGCAVSALEIACDCAALGAGRVVTATRRQRYIMQKIVAGVPVEYFIQTRHAATAQEASPKTAAADLKKFIVKTSGSPEMFGALKPSDDLTKAGVTQCQYYLPLVSEGRICAKPWITTVAGQTVTFADGTSEDFDGLVFGTGFEIDVAFLADDLRHRLESGGQRLDLYDCTFHPDFPGIAFAGLFQVGGPYFPPIELQARWIAYAWSGIRPLPSKQAMQAKLSENTGQVDDKHHMPSLTMLFAREAGVVPDLELWPELGDALLHGPLTPISFRLDCRDSLIDASSLVLEAAYRVPSWQTIHPGV